MELNTNLTAEQARFAVWIEERIPYLMPLFDFSDQGEYLPEKVERYLGVASSGQVIMAKFVLGVWLHQDKFDFDFTDAAMTLDKQNMSVITEWLDHPEWP
ncbi:MAG: hypothetical protein JKY42_11695 [Flavobacteriales bacterium]|nr:hypothetical protein [Flavobacteriales bacterium]